MIQCEDDTYIVEREKAMERDLSVQREYQEKFDNTGCGDLARTILLMFSIL